jgi:hypothetical protein
VKAGTELPLPSPSSRTPLHTRRVVYRGFRREDLLWDIEAELIDTKHKTLDIPGEGPKQPGETLHGMTIRVTINDHFVLQGIAVVMEHVPHRECTHAHASMQTMVGCTMGRGWRQVIERNLGGVRGCAHLRELLFNMATVAFQTLSHELPDDTPDHPPAHLGQCMTWDFNGAVVERNYPKFVGWAVKGK